MNVADQSSVNAKRFRALMGSFTTGVAIVTTVWRSVRYGMTVSSLTSVSLDPCMLLICPRSGSATGDAIANSRRFAVNILARNQEPLSHRFVSDLRDRFEGLAVAAGDGDLPLLPGCVAHATCSVADIHKGGDHDIIVANVTGCETSNGDPLVLFRGVFGTHMHKQPA